MNYRMKVMLVLFSPLLFCCADALAQPGGELKGRVTIWYKHDLSDKDFVKNDTGTKKGKLKEEPAQFLQVIVFIEGPQPETTRTNEKGEFAFEHLPNGDWDFTVSVC